MNKQQVSLKKALEASTASGKPFLSSLLSWDDYDIDTLLEVIRNIDEFNCIKRTYNSSQRDKTIMRQEIRDICTFISDNFVYPDFHLVKMEIAKFMELHQIDENPVYIQS